MLKTAPNPRIPAGELARALAALGAGFAPGKLAREVACRHPEDPSLAPRILDLASACLWLADGVPVADVLTMLECRHRFELSPTQCRAHAVEILWTVQHEIDPLDNHPITTPKEREYAAA
jgi:hypothetical protein